MIRQAQLKDLARIMEIERAGFTEAEAASEVSMQERIEKITDTFFVVEEAGEVRAFCVGNVMQQRYITDDLFETLSANVKIGGYQSILSIAVHPDDRGRGFGTQLLNAMETTARQAQRETITLTCKESLIRYYEAHGYINEGASTSIHGGESWFNLVKTL